MDKDVRSKTERIGRDQALNRSFAYISVEKEPEGNPVQGCFPLRMSVLTKSEELS